MAADKQHGHKLIELMSPKPGAGRDRHARTSPRSRSTCDCERSDRRRAGRRGRTQSGRQIESLVQATRWTGNSARRSSRRFFESTALKRCPLSWVLASRQRVDRKEHFPPALPALSHGQNISFYHLLGLAQDERSLSDLRSPFLSRARILSRCHVLQLRSGRSCARRICGGSLGPDHLASGEDPNLGSSTFPAFCAHDHTFFTCPLDLL